MAVCLLLTVCSLLSKEQGITVVAVCVVYDFLCLQKVGQRAVISIIIVILISLLLFQYF